MDYPRARASSLPRRRGAQRRAGSRSHQAPAGNADRTGGTPMIVRMGLIERLPSLSPEAFSAHWRGPHGTAASRMPNLRRYEQNHVVDDSQLGLAYPRGPWKLDGFSQLWFDDLAAMRTAISSAAYAGVATDTPTVMTMPGIIAAEPNVVQPL